MTSNSKRSTGCNGRQREAKPKPPPWEAQKGQFSLGILLWSATHMTAMSGGGVGTGMQPTGLGGEAKATGGDGRRRQSHRLGRQKAIFLRNSLVGGDGRRSQSHRLGRQRAIFLRNSLSGRRREVTGGERADPRKMISKILTPD